MSANNTITSTQSLRDLKYRGFMVALSRQFTTQDTEEFKYMLKDEIPAGIRERLTTCLKVLDHLENLELVGPDNLFWLVRLLDSMGTKKLRSMVTRFIINNASQLTEL
jgi:hypothetical protein